MNLIEAIDKLLEIRRLAGTSNYDAAVKHINRKRLLSDGREPRKKFSFATLKKLYHRQRGKCPLCRKDMALIRSELEIDHRDPNAADFNNESNLQVTHKKCNREKSSKSIMEQVKESGQTITEMVDGE